MNHENAEDESPAGRKPDELEPEKYQPKDGTSNTEYEKSGDHDVVLFPIVVSGGPISGGALPVNFAIISSVSCCLSLGR